MIIENFDDFIKKCSTQRLVKYKHKIDMLIKQRALHSYKSGVAATKTAKRECPVIKVPEWKHEGVAYGK